MRILVLSPWLPYPPEFGSSIRTYQLIKNLARHHRVSLLTYAKPDQEANLAVLRDICETVYTVAPPRNENKREEKRSAQLATLFSLSSFQSRSAYSPAMQAAIDSVLAEQDFDIVQVESSHMGVFRIKTSGRIVLNEHNVEYELLYRTHCSERSLPRKLYNGLEFLKFRAEEQQTWRRVDACLLTSQREEEIVRRTLPHKPMTVVPNGVDIDNFKASHQEEVDPNSIVFTGLMTYRPNIDGAVFFIKEVLPHIWKVRPSAVFTIVGQGASEEVYRLTGPQVIATGRVPDVRCYLEKAGAVVVPLRMGSGTRLKVLEGLAMSKAMVSTSLGCEGINVESGRHLMVADDPRQFAQNVLQVLDDPALATRLGRQGRALAEREYSWAGITDHLEEFYSRLLCPATPVLAC